MHLVWLKHDLKVAAYFQVRYGMVLVAGKSLFGHPKKKKKKWMTHDQEIKMIQKTKGETYFAT